MVVVILVIILLVFVWDSVIDAIKEYGYRGLNFYCIYFRLEEGSGGNEPQSSSVVNGSRGLDGGVSKQVLKSLFETVKSLCAVAVFLSAVFLRRFFNIFNQLLFRSRL